MPRKADFTNSVGGAIPGRDMVVLIEEFGRRQPARGEAMKSEDTVPVGDK